MTTFKKPDVYQVSIFAGVVLILFGVQLRLVDSYVLTPTATSFLAQVTGPPPESPHGSFRQFMVENSQAKHRIQPWPWLGWACLSAGGVLTAFGAMHKWRKR